MKRPGREDCHSGLSLPAPPAPFQCPTHTKSSRHNPPSSPNAGQGTALGTLRALGTISLTNIPSGDFSLTLHVYALVVSEVRAITDSKFWHKEELKPKY